MCKNREGRYPSAGDLARAILVAIGADSPAARDSLTLPIARTASDGMQRSRARIAPAAAFPPALASAGGDTPFVGRRDILDGLARRYGLVEAGKRQFVLLCGEPGVGKTRIAAQFAQQACARGGRVLYGRSDPESIVPYQPFITAIQYCLAHETGGELAATLDLELRELGRFIAGIGASTPELQVPAAVEPDARRYRLFEAVTRVLAFVATEQPLVLILDDLQWADNSTALLLRYVVQQIPDSKLLLIGTLRDVEACLSEDLEQLLARLRPQSSFERISVRGLDNSATAEMVAARDIGAATDAFVDRLRRTTNGNPLFIQETLKSVSEARPAGGGDLVFEHALNAIGVPDGVKDVIAQRVLRLTDATRNMLAVAALIGTEFHLSVLEALLHESADQIIALVEEAAAAGLVSEVDEDIDRFAFSHVLVREALTEQQSASRRMRLHHRIAIALESIGHPMVTNVAELAHHFFESRQVDGGRKALRYAVDAGDAAAGTLAHEEAAEQYRRALVALQMQAQPDDRRRCEVLLALGQVELRAGQAAARGTFEQAAELARRAHEPELLGRAALGFAGRYTEAGIVDHDAIAMLEEALAGLAADRSSLRIELTARLADAMHFAPVAGQTQALSHRALVMARQLGDTHSLLTALESRHTALLHIEHLDERLRLSEELLALAEGVGERELKALGLHWRIYDLLEASDVAGARRDHRTLSQLAEELRQPLYRHFAVGWEVVWAQMAGRVEESERLARESHELGRQGLARDAETVYAIQLVALRRREDRLSGQVATIEAAIEKHPSLVAWRAVLPLAHLAAGDHAQAVVEFERLAERRFASVPQDMFWFTAMCVLAETCSRLRDRHRAAILYEILLPYRDRNVQVTQAAFWGSAERFLGLLAAALGRFDAASAHYLSAVAKNEANGCPMAAGVVRRDYAEMLLARDEPGDAQTAVALLREMMRAADAAGMPVLVSHLRAQIEQVEGV